jgi:hypothetical protein
MGKQDQEARVRRAQRSARSKVAPITDDGVEASDLPDGGRGSVEMDFGKEAARHLPHQTGGTTGGQVGMRGHPDNVQAGARGGRKKN